ncbi:MAG: ABC transporter substrate binding protein [Candidatus Cloacimonetes bacterium]|nr:ABC transporter substrate binding protein [Candidatus Cloacimonadota bacterium]
MELWVGAYNLGMIYAFLAVGIYITSRILNFADITVDGSFTTGAAVTAILIVNHVNPFVAILLAFSAGMLCGTTTGIIHTKLKIDSLLAGILVMTALYSINLHIMGKSNIPLMNQKTLFEIININFFNLPQTISLAVLLTFIIFLFAILISIFFKTDLGLTLRSTGNNPVMTSASGINVDSVKIFGVALANGFVAVSGSLIAQYQGFADIGMGIGTLIIGLASVIIGEAVLHKRSILNKIISAVIGAVTFRFMIALALYVGMNPLDLKLVTSLFVLAALIISMLSHRQKLSIRKRQLRMKSIFAVATIAVITLAVFYIFRGNLTEKADSAKKIKIGVVQYSQNGILNITREAFFREMERLGFTNDNTEMIYYSADGDNSMMNQILEKFVAQKIDLILSISTPSTQAAINRIKDIPIVFATVANPFVFGIGKSNDDHLPNVTGVYGWVALDEIVDIARTIMPGKKIIGSLGNAAEPNTVFYLETLRRKVAEENGFKLIEKDVNNPNDVLDAVNSIVSDGAEYFVLPLDSVIYSAFDTILKATSINQIPVFTSDPEKLQNGALLSYGYDYASSGVQAAHIAQRILNGESPADIPLERYRKMRIGLNYKIAADLGLKFPEKLQQIATESVGTDGRYTSKKPRIGIASFTQDPLNDLVVSGIQDALASAGLVDPINTEILLLNANGDISSIPSMIQTLITKESDVIVAVTTPVLQGAMQYIEDENKPAIVFSFVSNPYAAGAGKDSLNHLPNITGYSCNPPFSEIIPLIREIFPEKKRIGIPWNSSETNSFYSINQIREIAPVYGFEIIEKAITNSSEVLDACNALAAGGADIILNPGDNTVNTAFSSVVKSANTYGLPVISDNDEHVKMGALFGLGVDFYTNGFDSGKYIIEILNGKTPAELPFRPTRKTQMTINTSVADKLGITIPEDILKSSVIISDSADNVVDVKSRKIALFHFNEHSIILQTIDGIKQALNEDDFLKKNNLKIDMYSAQNEFSLAQTIVQNIVRQKYDFMITASTPALQAGAANNKHIPHIFGAVTDPYSLGVADNPAIHQANLTGVATFQPVEYTLKLMREIFPQAKRIGIVWCPSEACSQACLSKARTHAPQLGFELIEVTVNSNIEIVDAVNSLIGKIDIFYTSGDNVVELSADLIANILKKHRIPYFTNSPEHVKLGSLISVGANYIEVGKATGRIAKQVIMGERTSDIPIYNFVPEKIAINKELLEEYKIKLPTEILKKAAITSEK